MLDDTACLSLSLRMAKLTDDELKIAKARAAALMQDREFLESDRDPPDDVLQASPLLDTWYKELHPDSDRGYCLLGYVSGHPELVDGRLIRTSAVAKLDPRGRWVRTVSRFYRLGRSHQELVVGLNQDLTG
jgi:hypothetical protein